MNYLNKIKTLSFSDSKIIRASSFAFLTAALVVGGFFVANPALATTNVNSASEGTNISIDTTSSAGGTGTYKLLSGPGINESAAGDISIGTHTITLPAGWEFDANSTISISTYGSDIEFASTNNISPDSSSFSFEVISTSTSAGFVGFEGLEVRPTTTAPSTGNMTYSGEGIDGVDESTNFGTLSTVPGTVTQLAFTTQPGDAMYGSDLSTQPVVKTQDQFGNNSTSGLGASLDVTLTLSSNASALVGDATLDVGTDANNGTVTFTDLTVDEFGTGKRLTANATDLTSADSDNFEITQKALTATVNVNNKDYDGDNSADIKAVELNGVIEGDGLGVDFSTAEATFASSDAGTRDISVTSVTLTSTDSDNDADNYTLADEDISGEGTINPLAITITPDANQTKIYGEADPTFTYTSDSLIGTDSFTGALSRVTGEDVGTYAYMLDDLSAGDNYDLALISNPDTFEIKQKSLTVTATGVNKVYDANTTAEVTLSSDDIVDGDDVTFGYIANFSDDKNVGVKKPVAVSAISITGDGNSGNYILSNTTADTTADITPVQLTASFTTYENKTYDGDDSADITSRSLDGVIGMEVVGVEGGSATFADKDIGNNKTVTATEFTLTEADKDNYTIGTVNTTEGNVNPRSITVMAVEDNRIYNGTESSDKMPEITSEDFSPAITGGDDEANFIQTYNTKNVGGNKTLTPSGLVNDENGGDNYDVTFATSTGKITKKSLNVTAQSDTKTYDGTTNSSVSPVVDNLETGDSITTEPTQSYDTEDVGSRILSPSGLEINNDLDGGNNYDVTYNNETGEIKAKELTVTDATTNSRTYDGGVNATVVFSDASLVGVISDDEGSVSLDYTDYSATYNNKNANVNVNEGKTVTVSGLTLTDNGASNYSLTQPTLNDGVITSATLTVTATGGTKVYDGTTDSNETPTITNGELQSDDTANNFTQSYDTVDVGDDKTLTPSGVVNDDNGGDNYDVTLVTSTGVITKASLTITADDKSKKYGDVNPNLTASYDGFVDSEDEDVLGDTSVILGTATSTSATSTVGDYVIITFGTVDDEINYDITFNSGTLTVNPATLTVIADDKTKEYASTSDPTLTYTYSGLVNDDTDTVFSGALTCDSGEDVGNYNINQGTLSAGSNYGITYNSRTLTIEDTVAPTIISHSPSGNVVNVAVASNITINFSEPVIIGEEDITLSFAVVGEEEDTILDPATDFNIRGSGTNEITLTPTSAWNDNTNYTVTVPTDVTDVNGNGVNLEEDEDDDEGSWDFTTATSYNVSLYGANTGRWNLISLPIVPSDKDISAVLSGVGGSVESVWTYDPRNPNADDSGWLVYTPDNPEGTNSLTTMTAGFGYWIRATDNATISGSGSLLPIGPAVTPPSRELSDGWNLIGYYQNPGEASTTPYEAFSSLRGSYTGLRYNNGKGSFESIENTSTIEPGDAFWISLPRGGEYTPSNQSNYLGY